MQIYFILFCKLNEGFNLDGKVQGNFSCFAPVGTQLKSLWPWKQLSHFLQFLLLI